MMDQAQYVSFLLLLVNSLLYATCSTSVQEDIDMDLHPFIKVGSKYYLVTQDIKMNWFGAAHFCRSYDSDLLTIESVAEKDALFSHLKPMFGSLRAWTSSNDLTTETYMSLNSGRPMIYKFWGKNEPNNVEDVEDCIEVILFSDSLTMNDNKCSLNMHVICEKQLPLNTCNSGIKSESNCEKVTGNCALKKLKQLYLQTANIFNCRE
nr:C-type lectin 37Db [Bactrocera oleae]XP_036222714.1 C-type lectin 37Db [Bactrocera oleae]XP_036222715.1 C-type lectin 37Db [Bactrocera oleae]